MGTALVFTVANNSRAAHVEYLIIIKKDESTSHFPIGKKKKNKKNKRKGNRLLKKTRVVEEYTGCREQTVDAVTCYN